MPIATSIDAPVPPPPHDPVPPRQQTRIVEQQPTTPIDKIEPTAPITPTTSRSFTATKIEDARFTVTVDTGTEIATVIAPHIPVLRGPTLDSRYIDGFQPNYPSDERLAGRGGRIVLLDE